MIWLSVARTCLQPNDGEIKNDSDIDRWENDGGRSVSYSPYELLRNPSSKRISPRIT